jgi:hypothetical protein
MSGISSKSAFTAEQQKISVTPVLERKRRIFGRIGVIGRVDIE